MLVEPETLTRWLSRLKRCCCKVAFLVSYRNGMALNSLSYIVAKCALGGALQQNPGLPLPAISGRRATGQEGPLPVNFSGSCGDGPMNRNGLGLAAPRVQTQSD